MKKFLTKFIILALVITPLTGYAQEAEINTYTAPNGSYTVNRPAGVEWKVSPDLNNDVHINTGNSTELIRNGYVYISEENLVESGYSEAENQLLIMFLMQCDEKNQVTFQGHKGVQYDCTVDDLSTFLFFAGFIGDVNFLDENTDIAGLAENFGTVHFKWLMLTINDSLYSILSYGGESGKDQANVDKILNSIQLSPLNTDNSVRNTAFLGDPLNVSVNNRRGNWQVFTNEFGFDGSFIYGYMNEDYTSDFSLSVLSDPVDTSLSDQEYLKERGYSEEDFFEDDESFSASVISTVYGQGFTQELDNVIRTVGKLSYALSENIDLYNASYFARFTDNSHHDLYITYTFIAPKGQDIMPILNQFEESIMRGIVIDRSGQISNPVIGPPMPITSIPTGLDINYSAYLNGQLIKGESQSTVYLLRDGKRYVFPNEHIFYTWYSDFSSLEQKSDAEIATYPLGGNITFKPGTLIKVPSINKVFVVERENIIRWIETEEVAQGYFGQHWASLVKDVSEANFLDYIEGQSIK